MSGKSVVILGDFMIDVWYLVSGRPSETSEHHGGVQPTKRINPTLPNERFGAAGIIADTIRHCVANNPGQPASIDRIIGLGVWNPHDDERWQRLGVKVHGRSPGTEGSELHMLQTEAGTSLATTLKIRVLLNRPGAAPQLVFRVDQDPTSQPIRFRKPLLPDAVTTLPRDQIAAVVVADFCKGAVSRQAIRELMDLTGWSTDIPWFVETKDAEPQRLLEGVPIHTLFFNRREAVTLARHLGASVESIPLGGRPTPELLEVADRIRTGITATNLVITLGEDGACLFEGADQRKPTGGGEPQVFDVGPRESRNDYPGVSAGDILIGRWVAECLRGDIRESGELLSLAGRTAHRWCVLQDVTFWENAERGSDAPQPGPDLFVTTDLPEWTEPVGEPLSEWSEKFRSRSMYPQLLGPPPYTLSLSHGNPYLPSYIATSEKLGTALRSLVKDLQEYARQQEERKPYVSLLVAAPGSGKSHLANALAKAAGFHLEMVNVAGLTALGDITRHFEQVSSYSAGRFGRADPLPLLVIDEVDATLEGAHIFKTLLSLTGDGVYEVNALKRRVGALAILLIASRRKTLVDFRRWVLGEEKGRDLWSRINGQKLELPPPSDADRVYMAAAMIRRRFKGIPTVDRGVLDIFGAAENLSPRDIERIVNALRAPGGELTCADLTSVADIYEDVTGRKLALECDGQEARMPVTIK